MEAIVVLGWALVIWSVIVLSSALRSGGGHRFEASEADPFPDHIHIIASQADIDRLPCKVVGCQFYEIPASTTGPVYRWP